MELKSLTGKKAVATALTFFLLTAAVLWLVVPDNDSRPAKQVVLQIPGVQPHRLALYNNNLYVLPAMGEVIHVLSYDGVQERVISLAAGGESRIFTSLAVNGEGLFLTTHQGELFVFDLGGQLVEAFGYILSEAPGNITGKQTDEMEMSAVAVTASPGFPQNLYVLDSKAGLVLVISLREVPGIVERFEMIMTIPSALSYQDRQVPAEYLLQKPTAVLATPDGRLLVADAAAGLVRSYSLHGWHIKDFPAGTKTLEEPIAIDLDGIRSSVQEESGGRLHVLDRKGKQVKVFTQEGKYMFSYGGKFLTRPSDIAIDQGQRLIFIADINSGIIKLEY